MSEFYVTGYGSKYAVRYPDGLLRCIVKSHTFAESICRDLNKEKFADDNPGLVKHKRSGVRRPVIRVDTGELFESVREAAMVTGVCTTAIRKDCQHRTKTAKTPRPRFEWAEALA